MTLMMIIKCKWFVNKICDTVQDHIKFQYNLVGKLEFFFTSDRHYYAYFLLNKSRCL